jgi:hypothetical protein
MAKNGNSYIVHDDIPLERFENFCMPPMQAKDVVLLLAGVSPFDYSRCELSPDVAAEVRRLLIDNMMPENPDADRAEVEDFVDARVTEVRAALT